MNIVYWGEFMKKIVLSKFKNIISKSIDIPSIMVKESTYPTIIMDKEFKIIFVNELALRLYDTSFEETFMKNYLGVYCKSEDEYDEFLNFYNNILENKKPVYVDNNRNNSYITIFPILSPQTGEVEYFYNIFTVEEFHMTSKQKDELRLSHDYIQFAHQLSVLLETKDRYTAFHSANVTKYSVLLGESVGINGLDLDILKLAASLHDIGKVNIPNNILNKPDILTIEEYTRIMEHPTYSGRILEVFRRLSSISSSGKYHHERYDGKGYPEGLSGRDIPRNARIISIADTFDAMTTDRPYRKALPVEQAIQELTYNKGKQFDPFLVDKFVNLDLENAVTATSDYASHYAGEYSIPPEQLTKMHNAVDEMFRNIDPLIVFENLIDYNFYGLIIAEDLGHLMNECGNDNANRFEILYTSDLVEKFSYEKYLDGNWEMCLKEKKLRVCNHCPVDKCLRINSTYYKKSKLTNNEGDVKYLNTLLHPVVDKQTGATYIIEIFKDETLNIRYGNTAATEFFNFVDNLYKIFASQDTDFSIIYEEMRPLCNWISEVVGVSEHKNELLNKALSVCDLGLIALIDSNEHSFESINKLRANKKHIDVIYNMITSLKTFSDIKDIVLYHHTAYNDTSNQLSGEEVPIQAYIISISDYLLTSTIEGIPINDTIDYIISLSGTRVSPLICDALISGENMKSLISTLERVALKKKHAEKL